jgi:hypothetical protein
MSRHFVVSIGLMLSVATAVPAQEARRRRLQRQIRLDKFEQVLPVAMKSSTVVLR